MLKCYALDFYYEFIANNIMVTCQKGGGQRPDI